MAGIVTLTASCRFNIGDGTCGVSLVLGGRDPGSEYRARMFFEYSGISSYTGGSCYGLFGTVSRGTYVRYDDWDSAFRPPRSDSDTECFNVEVVAGFDGDHLDATFHAVDPEGDVVLDEMNLRGHSFGDAPTQFLVERLDRTARVVSVSSSGGVVTVVTDGPHGFSDGDAISLYGIPDAGMTTSDHMMGVDGERYMGTFRISVNPSEPSAFMYTTGHYVNPAKPHTGMTAATASRWVPCTFGVDDCTVGPGVDGLAVSKPGIGSLLREGDYVMLIRYDGEMIIDSCAMVIDVQADSVVLDCPPDAAEGPFFGLRYCGSTPSAAVPVNWPDYVTNLGSATLANSPVYDHTVNTVKIQPTRDAAFSSRGGIAQGKTELLEVSSTSVAVFSFTPPLVLAMDDAGAILNIYATGMTNAVGTVVLYQMKSSGWEYSMTLGDVTPMVSDIPVSHAELADPSLSGGPGRYVSFAIPGSVIRRWVTESNRYPMDIAAVYVGTGGVSLMSSESPFPPYMTVSGGAKAVEDPDLFSIYSQVSHAAPGSVVRFYVQDGAEIDDSVFSDSVWFVSMHGDHAETEAFIVSGSSKFVDVIVPSGLNGDYMVELRGKRPDGTTVVLTDDSCRFYVDGNPQMRVVRLASKVAPGNVVLAKVGTRGMYNKDFAFDGFVDVTDKNSLIQNVYSILLTRRGERMFMPKFGSTVEDRIFEILDDGDADEILSECIAELREHEPRVEVSLPDSYVTVDEGGNGVVVTLGLVMPSGVTQAVHIPYRVRSS